MRTIILRTALLLALAPPALAAEPVLTRVTLSTGGVGQYLFTADVDGAAVLQLDVPLDQVDDVLKSLQVDDPAGTPAGVRLPGRQPLSESFRTLPFGPAAFASPEALLGALVGAAVRVPGAGASGGAAGTILAVTPFEAALPNNAGTLTRHRLTLATATGIETLVLEDTPGLDLTSDALRRQVGTALQAIAAQRVQDRRTLQVALGAGGPRTVRFGYVVPAPVWKASYRLTVPPEGQDGPARLQAFAVVENLSGRDWRDVEVVLTGGQPVLYHQPLYEAVFTARPEAPVDVPNRLTPAVDAGAVPGGKAAGPADEEDAPPGAEPPRPVPAPAPMMRMAAPRSAATPAQPPAEVQQTAAQVRFRLQAKVSAASGESLLLPLADRPVPGRRVALYRADAGDLHPLVALLLSNDGPGALPPGLATLYEAGAAADGPGPTGPGLTGPNLIGPNFIGDARLPAIQPGEDRLASFAADLPVRVDATKGEDATITGGRAARGVLDLVRRQRATSTYRVTTPADGGRTVLIEQPRRDGWTLVEPNPALVGTTPTHYRISQAVPPGTTWTVPVVLERPVAERVVLTDAPVTRLSALASEGQLSPALRAALTRAGALRTELDRRTGAVNDLNKRQAAIVADQDRLRRNLAAVPSGSELQRRYLGTLQKQETDLAALATQAEVAGRAVTDADTALKDFLGGLTL
jgi:hypothetical protein